MAIAVVIVPLGRIAQDLVSLGRLFEFLFRLRIADIAVRMMLHGQPPIGPLDFLFLRVPGNSEDLVIIPFDGHRVFHFFYIKLQK